MSFTPFYDYSSQKKLNKKVKSSNNAHRRLEERNNNRINERTVNHYYKLKPSQLFYDLIRRDYHVDIYNWQSNNNRVATHDEKKKIYRKTFEDRVEINKHYGNYVPRKYRK